MTEIDEQQEFPSDDQWQVLVDTAPDPIAGDVEAAVAILEEDGEEAIGSPELEPHLDAVFGFRDDRCTAR